MELKKSSNKLDWVKRYTRPGNIQFDEMTRVRAFLENKYFPGVVTSLIVLPAGRGFLDFYVPDVEWNRLMKKISQSVTRKKNYLKIHQASYRHVAARYYKSGKAIPTNPKKLSNSAILHYYRHFMETTNEMWLYFYTPWAIDEVIEPLFNALVRTRFPQHANFIIEATGGLTQEVRFNQQFKQLYRLKANHQLTAINLRKHAQAWGYLKLYTPHDHPYEPHDFRQMVSGAGVGKKVQALNYELRLSQQRFRRALKILHRDKKLETLSRFINWYVYLRTERIDLYREVTGYSKRLYHELDRRLGLSRCQSSCMTIQEIINFLERNIKPNLREIRQREKIKYAWFVNRGSIQLFISQKKINNLYRRYIRNYQSVKELKGLSAFPGVIRGTARIIFSIGEINKLKRGDILVTSMTRPEYVHIMQKAAAYVTDEGGITCHAAIMAREFKKPCVIGTKIATKVINDGDFIEVDANRGIVTKLHKYL